MNTKHPAMGIEPLESRRLLATATASVALVHSFTGGSEGGSPEIINADSKGNVYGVSFSSTERGTAIFKIASGGGGFSILHSFGPSEQPVGGVGAVDPAGDFFGVQYNADSTTEAGSLFEIPAGTASVKTIHSFAGVGSKTSGGIGDIAPALLTTDGTGNLYGATSETNLG